MASASWLDIDEDSPFSIDNIPFGVISHNSRLADRQVAVAVGEYAILLQELVNGGALSQCPDIQPHLDCLRQPSLNDFASLGRPLHQTFRLYLRDLLRADTPYPGQLRDNRQLRNRAFFFRSDCANHVPMIIGDYTDFYAGVNHARNVGTLFRGAQNALQPNYMHLPVGYHGRASSIRPSGCPIRRPAGQILPAPEAAAPVHSASRKLDMELEMAAFLCKGNGPDGRPISIAEASSHIFGYVLMNDWSARDIQAWEYVPLGPFNSKNFATTISPWIVLADALEPHRCQSTTQRPVESALLPYLDEKSAPTFHDIPLSVRLEYPIHSEAGSNDKATTTITDTNASHLMYSFPQMLVHHTVGGCEMRVGDLLGSGTISGDTAGSLGSLLEMTDNGKTPLKLDDSVGSQRTFLEDGDEVVMTGKAGSKGAYIGFGDCRGIIVPAY
ncbi:uncharacterized protein LTR77_005311 [Saxophila tyrrhenica]|uniref:Fumarylacetoacetase n=1 Tax=Saxophila tyrrhenica TaxID=1690608 RepID=A0AAV9P845_9PEZI|nr:hypothetical protein LTR77_005311 [Saxophila tyrrhenica]